MQQLGDTRTAMFTPTMHFLSQHFNITHAAQALNLQVKLALKQDTLTEWGYLGSFSFLSYEHDTSFSGRTKAVIAL